MTPFFKRWKSPLTEEQVLNILRTNNPRSVPTVTSWGLGPMAQHSPVLETRTNLLFLRSYDWYYVVDKSRTETFKMVIRMHRSRLYRWLSLSTAEEREHFLADLQLKRFPANPSVEGWYALALSKLIEARSRLDPTEENGYTPF